MTSATNERQDTAVLRIEDAVTIHRCAELKEALLAPLASKKTLEVDLSGVTEIDTAGLQVLMLAKIVAQARGSAVRLVAHSTALLDALELIDLAGYFGDPIVMTARGQHGI